MEMITIDKEDVMKTKYEHTIDDTRRDGTGWSRMREFNMVPI